MHELLLQLDKKPTFTAKVFLFLQMFLVVGGFLLIIDALYSFNLFSIVEVQIIFWGLWFIWQGIFFEKNRRRFLKSYPENPYKAAYYRDILLGVAFGISQMLRPFYHGMVHAEIEITDLKLFLFCLLIVFGLSLMVAGFRAIGFAAAGFLNEYKPSFGHKNYLVKKGIYKIIQHPLFLGGTIASLGSSLIFSSEIIWLGVVNIGILPIYHLVESSRQRKILGQTYVNYSSGLGVFIPRVKRIKQLISKIFKFNKPETSESIKP